MNIKKFVKECKNLENTKFEWYGRTKDGLDCAGLLITARNKAGYIFFDYKEYSKLARNFNINEILSNISIIRPSITKKDLEEGDIISISYRKLKYATHIMIYLGNNKVIHSDHIKGVVIEELEDNISIHSIHKLK